MTVQSLSRMPGTGLPDLQDVSTGIQEYIRAADNETRAVALESISRQGLLQRIFPNQYEKERRRANLQTMRQLADSRRELLGVLTKTQVEIARKRADAMIAAQSMHMQTELAQVANEKINDLNSTINRSLERFLGEIDPQYDLIEKYRHRPELHRRALESLDRQIDVYFNSTNALLNGFVQSLGSKVGEVGR